MRTQAVTRKTRILDVMYNASNNELVRTQTLVKNAIIQIDATPFKQWYQQHYNVELGAKNAPEQVPKPDEVKVRGRGRVVNYVLIALGRPARGVSCWPGASLAIWGRGVFARWQQLAWAFYGAAAGPCMYVCATSAAAAG